MLEGFDFTVSYILAAGIRSLHIIIEIASTEVLIIYVVNISNAFQDKILPNPAERAHLRLPYLYLEWYKIKWPKQPLASINQK